MEGISFKLWSLMVFIELGRGGIMSILRYMMILMIF